MFRYLALSWDDKSTAQGAVAGPFVRAMQAADSWQGALEVPGLHVFVKGQKSGINDAYSLGSADGVIVGRLFRRGDAVRVQTGARLRVDEQEQILRSGGQTLVNDYWGRYVAFLRLSEGRFVLRDPVGGLPCFQLQHDGVGIVFPWLEDVLSLLAVPTPPVAWDCLAAHIAFVSLSGRETVLHGVTQVLPGERASLPPGPPSSTLLWHAASFAAAPLDVEPGRAAVELRTMVRDSVGAWAGCFDHVLMRLSGGLDSSIVLSCLGTDSASAEVTCLNYHSPGSNSDERSYARLAAARARRPLIERDRDSDYPLKRVLDVARTPLPPNYLGRLDTARMDATLAHDLHADAMFTGGGGDQLFFQFKDWWAAADYLAIRGLGRGFLSASMDAARLSNLSVWRVMRLVIRDHFGREAAAADSRAHLSLAMRESLPRPSERGRYTHPLAESLESLPLAKRLHLQLLSASIDTYDPYEREAAPDIVNPLLSQPLVEYCLTLPSYVLTSGGEPRALARQAFAKDIPVQIVARHSKGGIEEHITSILQRNVEFARAVLLDGELVRRGLVDSRKIESILSDQPTTLAAHTTEVHIYLGIEAWLTRMGAVSTSRGPDRQRF